MPCDNPVVPIFSQQGRVELQRQESGVVMQSAASVVFFQPEFNNFLYAPIGGATNAMPVSVLSALSRLDIDPWLEAATLSALPKEDATQRLANTIARLPGRQWALADCDAIAERLTRLLPRRQQSDTTATTVRPQLPPAPHRSPFDFGIRCGFPHRYNKLVDPK